MAREQTSRPSKSFTRGVRRSVSLPTGELVESRPARPGASLPLVFEPAVDQRIDLARWADSHRAEIERKLLAHGALLFRGFEVADPEAFRGFAEVVCSELFEDNGEHPRDSLEHGVYTPVFYPPDQKLLWHNENSFNLEWPRKILFCCRQPAERGGETPVVDSRRVLEAIDPEIRDSFRRRGVTYLRNYGEGLGLGWRQVFQSSSRAEVEAICEASGTTCEWQGEDRLRTSSVRPATVVHPVTGEESWFNQAQHWHPACLDAETRRSLRSLYGPLEMPRNCLYGDGEPIEDEVMTAILEVYQGLEEAFPWQRGDVMLVDNVLAAHGRNPFEGQRKLLVAMGEMRSYEQDRDGRQLGETK